MGKYSHIVATLPKFKGKDAQAERIQALCRKIEQEPDFVRQASALATSYAKLRVMREILDHVESSLELRTEAVQELAIDQYENEGTLSLKLDEGVMFEEARADLIDEIMALTGVEFKLPVEPTVRVQDEPYAKVVDKEAFRQWCVKNGLEQELRLWPSTTRSIVNERLLAGDKLPDGVEAEGKFKLVLMKG